MPVEIKELVIRTVVNAEAPTANDELGGSNQSAGFENEAIVQECVRQVLNIIARKGER